MGTVSANFTFEIGGAAGDDSVGVEIDTRSAEDGGDNARRLGRTSNFEPGDAIGFLVYFDPAKLEIDYISSSVSFIPGASITVGRAGQDDRRITYKEENAETVTFSQRGEKKTISKKAIAGTFSAKPVGNNPLVHFGDGNATLADDGITFSLPAVKSADQITDADTEATKAAKLKLQRVPSVFQCTYQTLARLCRIQTPSKFTIVNDAVNFSTPAPWNVHVVIYMKKVA